MFLPFRDQKRPQPSITELGSFWVMHTMDEGSSGLDHSATTDQCGDGVELTLQSTFQA
jgi:hypothetical protein